MLAALRLFVWSGIVLCNHVAARAVTQCHVRRRAAGHDVIRAPYRQDLHVALLGDQNANWVWSNLCNLRLLFAILPGTLVANRLSPVAANDNDDCLVLLP